MAEARRAEGGVLGPGPLRQLRGPGKHCKLSSPIESGAAPNAKNFDVCLAIIVKLKCDVSQISFCEQLLCHPSRGPQKFGGSGSLNRLNPRFLCH